MGRTVANVHLSAHAPNVPSSPWPVKRSADRQPRIPYVNRADFKPISAEAATIVEREAASALRPPVHTDVRRQLRRHCKLPPSDRGPSLRRRTFLGQILATGGLIGAPLAFASERPYGTQSLVRLPDKRPGLWVKINGQGPFLFLIDTATSHTVLIPRLKETLRLATTVGSEADVITAAGSVRSYFHPIAEITASGVTVEGTRAIVIDLPLSFGISGILGADFLSNFTVDLNLAAGTVSLYPQYTQLRGTGLQRVRGQLNAHGFIIVPVRIANIWANGAFDSGAEYTVVNSRVAAYARRVGMITVERPIENKVIDAAHQKRWALSEDFERISLGPATWLGARAMISDMRVFDQIGIGEGPAIFIGMDLMVNRRIILDYGDASLHVARY